jgi:hypothetical protein
MRQRPKPLKPKAKLPVARKPPENEGSRVRDLEKRLAEALGQLQARNRELVEAREQQTATSDILRVISSSPTDAQPVFDAILRSAVTLCNSLLGNVVRVDGDLVRLVATLHPRPEEVARSTQPPSRHPSRRAAPSARTPSFTCPTSKRRARFLPRASR